MMRRRPGDLSLPVLVSTLLWGLVELLALFRSRWSHPEQPHGR